MTDTPTIATFLQVYKRPGYFDEQVVAIRNQTIPSNQLWVIHNEGGKKFEYPEDAQLVYADPNLKFHLRFAVALLVDTEYVAFFDDDFIPQPKWYENCIDTIGRYNCVCVTNGVRVNATKDNWVKIGWCNPNNTAQEVDFGGGVWFMRREHLDYMFREPILLYDNGEDIMIGANLQRFGGVPIYVPPHPVDQLDMWGTDPEKAVQYGSDKVAHWIVSPTHFDERFALIREYCNRGWKLLVEREQTS